MNMEVLFEGDCLEIMRTLPSESVDMIFADPPFNVGKKYGGKSNTDNRSDYYEWCASWIEEGFRLLKPTGSFYLMTIPRHVFRMGCEMEKHGVFINKVEWRNVSAFHNKRGFWSSTQPIVVFGKTDQDIGISTVEGMAEKFGINQKFLYEWVKTDSEFSGALERFRNIQESDPDKIDTPEDIQVSGMLMAIILTVTRDRHYKPEGS